MLNKLEEELRRGDKKINVFGFSRGATSVLQFLNCIQDKINAGDTLYKDVHINLVVLWDTVKTTAIDYRTELPNGMNFEHKPIHFIALDERRREFFDAEVLNVQGAIQIGMRGVHADVGNGYKKSPFGWLSLKTTFIAATLAGLKFHSQTLAEYWGPTDWRATPTDNNRWFYHGNEPRTFPSDMYLHWSVKDFGRYSTPLNDISGYRELPSEVWYKW